MKMLSLGGRRILEKALQDARQEFTFHSARADAYAEQMRVSYAAADAARSVALDLEADITADDVERERD